MASPSLILLIFASILTLAIFCNGDLIDDVCARTSDISPASCSEALRSDPHSRGADLIGLGKIAIKKARAATRETLTVARSSNNSAVRVCHELCSRVDDDLTTASIMMVGQIDYRTKFYLRNTLSAVLAFIEYCNDAFAETIDGEPPEVKEAATIAQGLVDIVLIIGTML